MDVNRSKLQKAFAVSSNAADSPVTPERERVLFRKIARLIWDACGADWQVAEGNNLVQANESGVCDRTS
jgi:hypothetical protein